MDVLLVYIIKALLLPPASLIVLVFIGAMLLVRGRKSGFNLLLVTLLIWYLISTPLIANVLVKSLETYPPLRLSQLTDFKPQVIVVLGGGIHLYAPEYGNTATVSYKTLERLRYATRLAKLTKLPILVTGGKVFEADRLAEAVVMAKALAEDFGLDARWQESQSRNTSENARFSYALLSKQHITKIMLVTHALHMPRATQEFRDSGFELLPAPTGYLSDYSPKDILSFLPSANAFLQSTWVIHEYIGDFWMQLKAQVPTG